MKQSWRLMVGCRLLRFVLAVWGWASCVFLSCNSLLIMIAKVSWIFAVTFQSGSILFGKKIVSCQLLWNLSVLCINNLNCFGIIIAFSNTIKYWGYNPVPRLTALFHFVHFWISGSFFMNFREYYVLKRKFWKWKVMNGRTLCDSTTFPGLFFSWKSSSLHTLKASVFSLLKCSFFQQLPQSGLNTKCLMGHHIGSVRRLKLHSGRSQLEFHDKDHPCSIEYSWNIVMVRYIVSYYSTSCRGTGLPAVLQLVFAFSYFLSLRAKGCLVYLWSSQKAWHHFVLVEDFNLSTQWLIWWQ